MPAGGSDTETYLPFDAGMAVEVLSEGNYALVAVPVKLIGLWGWECYRLSRDAGCPEIEGPLGNDIADIAATVLTDLLVPSVAPIYPIYPIYPISTATNPSEEPATTG